MAFCQGVCNWVCQPPLQLRGVGIYSHGCKQGCFQPPGPGGVAGADVPDSAIMWQGRWYSSTMVVIYTRGESARWLGSQYEGGGKAKQRITATAFCYNPWTPIFLVHGQNHGRCSCSDNQQAKAIPFAGLPNAAIPTVLICSKKHGN